MNSKTCEINKSCLPVHCGSFPRLKFTSPQRKSQGHVTACFELLINQFNWLLNLTNHLSAVISCQAWLSVQFPTRYLCFWCSRRFKRKTDPLFHVSLCKSEFGYKFFSLGKGFHSPLSHFIFLMRFLWQPNQWASATAFALRFKNLEIQNCTIQALQKQVDNVLETFFITSGNSTFTGRIRNTQMLKTRQSNAVLRQPSKVSNISECFYRNTQTGTKLHQ